MDNTQTEQKLTSLIKRAIEMPIYHQRVFQLYEINKEDSEFAQNELKRKFTDLELRLDSLIKLYIAFYLDTIPVQIVANLNTSKSLFKDEDAKREYLLAIAGIMHEARTLITENSEQLLPYLIAYKDYLGNGPASDVPDDELVKYFVSVLDEAIQAVINY